MDLPAAQTNKFPQGFQSVMLILSGLHETVSATGQTDREMFLDGEASGIDRFPSWALGHMFVKKRHPIRGGPFVWGVTVWAVAFHSLTVSAQQSEESFRSI